MARHIDNKNRALFDVRPIKFGQVDFDKIASVSGIIDLKKRTPTKDLSPILVAALPAMPLNSRPNPRPKQTKEKNIKGGYFGHVINNIVKTPHSEFEGLGISLVSPKLDSKPSRINTIPKEQLDSLSRLYKAALVSSTPDEYSDVITMIREPMKEKHTIVDDKDLNRDNKTEMPDRTPPSISEIDKLISQLDPQKPEVLPTSVQPVQSTETLVSNYWKQIPTAKKRTSKLNIKKIVVPLLIVVGLIWFMKAYGLSIRNEVLKDGNSAVKNLEQAELSIRNYDFKEAAISFTKAYEDFNKANDNLNFMGSWLSSAVSNLPGAGALKSARSLLELGQAIARSGQAMSDAISYLSETGDILNQSNSNSSNARVIESLSNSLFISQKNIEKASSLIKDVNVSDIPEEKRDDFNKLVEQLPVIKEAINDASEYSDFVEKLVAVGGRKTYILLFQNNSELRPTGGFPGTYGLITFEDGRLADFRVDDIYNFDGQIKRNVIPPKQLQHITPTWGMRDANWFIDFPTSARKIMQFYTEISGQSIDGVITAGPNIVVPILKIVGPIEMPEYKMTINADNFLAEIQEEVEYGPNRTQPKQVVKDLAPKLLDKIHSSSPDDWMAIFEVIMSSLEKKDMIMYFNDLSLKNFAHERGFDGSIVDTGSDYLMVNFANIKGSKTDVYTDSSLKVSTILKEGMAVHKLTINRNHNGGNTKYGFYNKPNPAFVRVVVPTNAQLIEISGNDDPQYKPLIDYSRQSNFVHDEDLRKFESAWVNDSQSAVSLFDEADKKVFGFWMITDPGKSKTIELRYTVPIDEKSYSLYVQKQPGIEMEKFEVVMRGPDNLQTASFSPLFNRVGNVFEHSSHLAHDVFLSTSFK